jgi:hypothetical protein
MKSVLINILFFIQFSLVAASGPGQIISCNYKNLPFAEFCNIIHDRTGVTVYFEEKWVDEITVTINADSITVLDAVELAIKGWGLKVSVWHNNLVLLPGEKLITELPAFITESPASDVTEEEVRSLTASEERYLTGRKAEIIQTIRVGKAGDTKTNTKAKVLGRVLDNETGEPVNYATIYIEETKSGAVSDINGFFTILLKPGKYNALFDFIGYEKKKYWLEVYSDGEFTISLKKVVYQIEEFVVHGDRQMSIKDKDPGLDKISMRTVKDLPMLMGERDILKVSGTLPGIVSVGEGSAGLNVRGGSADQNAFYIDRIPIYNTSHMFGFFPAFNSDIINDFSIYKGHIPAEYGGRLSSVFNISSRKGNRKNFTAHGGLSPTSANIVVEGPLKKDMLTVLLSARSTYSDWILQRIKDPDIRASEAAFYDLSGGLNFDNQKTQLSLFGYHSKDRFSLSDLTDYSYENSGLSFVAGHNFSRTFRGEFSLVGAQYSFRTIDKQEISSAYEHAFNLGHYEARADFTVVLNDKNKLDFGVGALLYQLNRGVIEPYSTQSLRKKTDLGKEKGVEGALYVSDSYDPLPWLNLTVGLRYALYTPLGPKNVYTYSPDLPLDSRYIADSIQFGNNEAIKWYSEPDLRAAINFETDERGSVKLAFNQMHQNLFMLNNTIAVSPNAQWKLADYHLSPSKSNQLSLGVFRALVKSGIEFSAEVYYKRILNYPNFKDGANFLENPLVETTVLQGTQNSYGVEFFIKRSNRRLEGWMSYTYSRSIVEVNGDQSWNRINNGKVFPANYDVPHVFNLVLNYHLSRRITFSTIVTYQSGKPITYPVSVYYVDGVPIFDYSDRNAYRIPNYFRLDLSVTIEGSLRRNKFIHSSFNISVYNLTGRENPYAVYFKAEYGTINSYQYSVIGVPIPTVTWLFKLGNYASK